MNKILVIAEQRGGELMPITEQLLFAALTLKGEKGHVYALICGHNLGDLPKTVAKNANTVYAIDHINLKNYLTAPYTDCVCEINSIVKPDVILVGATSIGRDLAPRVSARLSTGLTADCTSLEMTEAGLQMTRPAFGGNLFATIACPNHRPQMSTVRPGVFSACLSSGKLGEVINHKFEPSYGEVELIEEKIMPSAENKIEDAKMLVAVGRGMSKHIVTAKSLAKALGASVASSRAVVDAGFMPHESQVGQTGKTVRPECYIALGISGAVQHLAGMESSDYIIAVNKDKDAPIFAVADLGLVGDANEIATNLINLTGGKK